MNQRFLPINRLKSKKAFQSVFASPHKRQYQGLLALYTPNLQSYARVGIMVGKHKVKQAVNRNWLRRIIRESFRCHKEVVKGLDIIVLMRSEWTALNKTALRDDIDCLWHRITLAKPA